MAAEKDIQIKARTFGELRDLGYEGWLKEVIELNDGQLTQSQINQAWYMTIAKAHAMMEYDEVSQMMVPLDASPQEVLTYALYTSRGFTWVPDQVRDVALMREAYELKQMEEQQQQEEEESEGSDCQETSSEPTGFQQSLHEMKEQVAGLVESSNEVKNQLAGLQESMNVTKTRSTNSQKTSIPITASTAGTPVQSSTTTLPPKNKHVKLTAEEKKIMRLAQRITQDFEDRLHTGHDKWISLMQERYSTMSIRQLEVAWRVEGDRRKELKKRQKAAKRGVRDSKVVEAEKEEDGAEQTGDEFNFNDPQ